MDVMTDDDVIIVAIISRLRGRFFLMTYQQEASSKPPSIGTTGDPLAGMEDFRLWVSFQ
jgi:hypothetical protein